MAVSDLDYIHDVKCPVCGTVPTYEITKQSYATTACNHKGMWDLIEKRENEIAERLGTSWWRKVAHPRASRRNVSGLIS